MTAGSPYWLVTARRQQCQQCLIGRGRLSRNPTVNLTPPAAPEWNGYWFTFKDSLAWLR